MFKQSKPRDFERGSIMQKAPAEDALKATRQSGKQDITWQGLGNQASI